MGAGEALMEEQGFRAWMHKKPSLLDYKIPHVARHAADRGHRHRDD
jgi:hypothetical protein